MKMQRRIGVGLMIFGIALFLVPVFTGNALVLIGAFVVAVVGCALARPLGVGDTERRRA